MPKAKQAQPPPWDDPAQSKKFMKDAAELMSADGPQLFERAMEALARPAQLPAKQDRRIIRKPKAANQKGGGG